MSSLQPAFLAAAVPRDPGRLAYVRVAPGGRYFVTENGLPFLAIGHNEGICWPHLRPLRGERNLSVVEAYLAMLAASGVTVLRIMLEYGEDQDWFFENPVGRPVPEMLQYWDNLIGLCERHGVRLLLAFWDTYFMYRRWHAHPYAQAGSGFAGPRSFFTSAEALAAQQDRVRFFIERWGNSPAIFAYDLFNELSAEWGSVADQFRWVTGMARFVKQCEETYWGKRHLLTVSSFGPRPDEEMRELVLRHPELDFATTHVYRLATIDNPENTVECALAMEDGVAFALTQITDLRPYIDSEHGPIHLYLDLGRQLPAAFDAEYFHNMAWAHLASGGAGSGLRWPFRCRHVLTPRMHAVQRGLARCAAALDWSRFAPQPLAAALQVVCRNACAGSPALPVIPFGCADANQALIWLLRDRRSQRPAGSLPAADLVAAGPAPASVGGPKRGWPVGDFEVSFWRTYDGVQIGRCRVAVPPSAGQNARLRLPLPAFSRDLALVIRRI